MSALRHEPGDSFREDAFRNKAQGTKKQQQTNIGHPFVIATLPYPRDGADRRLLAVARGQHRTPPTRTFRRRSADSTRTGLMERAAGPVGGFEYPTCDRESGRGYFLDAVERRVGVLGRHWRRSLLRLLPERDEPFCPSCRRGAFLDAREALFRVRMRELRWQPSAGKDYVG